MIVQRRETDDEAKSHPRRNRGLARLGPCQGMISQRHSLWISERDWLSRVSSFAFRSVSNCEVALVWVDAGAHIEI